MPAVELSPKVYQEAEKSAQDHGLTVEDYLSNLIQQDVEPEFDEAAFFTPERLAEIDAAIAEARDGGKSYSAEEVFEHFERKSQAWCEKEAR